MITKTQLYPVARRAFWAYFFILLNFHLSFQLSSDLVFALQLLPTSLGWWLLGRAAEEGAAWRPSLKLLSPFCLGLAVWSVQQFVPTLEPHIPAPLSLVAGVVTLYTHFQFLTDLSALADEAMPGEGEGSGLRSARTVAVVAGTLAYIRDLPLRLPAIAILLVLVNFCAYLYILLRLWALSKALAPAAPPQG